MSGIGLNKSWVDTYGDNYLGQWVAVRDGLLVDSDTDRRALVKRLGSVRTPTLVTRIVNLEDKTK